MKMSTIGILTYWGVPNYGAWTQAYALNNVVKKIVNNKVEVVHLDYLSKYHWDHYYVNDEKLMNSFSYSWNEISHSHKITEKELGNIYFDAIITGSDAIWEFSVAAMGNDSHLIGNDLNTKNLIAYAASFGVTSEQDGLEIWVKEGLEKYNKIMVRDEHSKNVVKKINPRLHTDVVLDPALLWNFKEDKNIKLPAYSNYYVVYGTTFSEDFIKNTIKLAHENGCKLISVGYINHWCDINLKMIELRGTEWIGMFKNAQCVITSTFHGLMVGLSYEKPIKFYQTDYVKNRSNLLVEKLKIPNHKKEFEKDIDYSSVLSILNEMREESRKYLEDALGEYR